MRLAASYIGSLALKNLQNGETGIVKHVFKNTIYIEKDSELLVISRKSPRAPINIGLRELQASLKAWVNVGDSLKRIDDKLFLGNVEIELRGAYVYEPSIPIFSGEPSFTSLEDYITEAAFMLSLLYETSQNPIQLPATHEFKQFIQNVITPLSRGNTQTASKLDNYTPLLGLGGGFTPSGDDFIAGFLTTINALTKHKITIDRNTLLKYTSWASALLIDYAQHGIVDETLASLLISIHDEDGEGFMDCILALAQRGHNSGIDISLGVLTALAALSRRENLIERVLRQINC
ncbi:MAG: DUF2877 domain-containing protein [Aigarchaeota archaeon]|nr:DUF2877 domain-containing protein [Candidatus Pelearchaeum maunauluense]